MSTETDPFAQDPMPKAKGSASKVVLVVMGLTVVSAVVTCGGLAVMLVGGGVLFALATSEEPVTAQERSVVMDIEHLAQWMDYTPDKRGESLTKTRYIDDSYDVEYEFDLPDDPDAPFLSCTVTVERKMTDTHISYGASWAGVNLGMAMVDQEVDVVERNDLFTWGDASRFAILEADGQPFGNAFITRKDTHIFYVLWSGVYFDDSETIAEVLSEPLSQLSAYEP